MNGSFLSVPYHAFRVDLLSPLFFSSPPPKFCSKKAVCWFSSKPRSAAWRVVCQTLMCERSLRNLMMLRTCMARPPQEPTKMRDLVVATALVRYNLCSVGCRHHAHSRDLHAFRACADRLFSREKQMRMLRTLACLPEEEERRCACRRP